MNYCLDYIKSDCYRYTANSTIKAIVKLYIMSATFRWQVAFRLCHGRGLLKFIGLVLWTVNRTKKYIQIARKTKIGYGLYLGHAGGGIVINGSAEIGNNCNISQFVTIGSNENHAAHIGDNVYVGPNVCIVEDVVIGNNVTIGAGSVVCKNIPDNVTAAGNYAKVLNFNNPGRYIVNRWRT